MENLLRYVGVLVAIIALLIGASECQNIKENELVGVAGGGFGGGSDVKRELRAAKYGGRKGLMMTSPWCGGGGGGVGEYGGCSDLKSEGDSKRMESQP